MIEPGWVLLYACGSWLTAVQGHDVFRQGLVHELIWPIQQHKDEVKATQHGWSQLQVLLQMSAAASAAPAATIAAVVTRQALLSGTWRHFHSLHVCILLSCTMIPCSFALPYRGPPALSCLCQSAPQWGWLLRQWRCVRAGWPPGLPWPLTPPAAPWLPTRPATHSNRCSTHRYRWVWLGH